MALKGDLASVDLAQVFQMLALNQKVGLLCIQSPDAWKALYFDERGVTLYFNEHTTLDRVVFGLTRSGYLAEDGIQEAREHAARNGQSFTEVLLAGGYLSEEDLDGGIRSALEEEIYELFFWRDAKFEFHEGVTSYEGQEGVVSDRFFFSTDMLIMEAARRIDEWGHIKAVVPTNLEVHRPVSGAAEAFNLDEDCLQIFELVDGCRNVERLIEMTGHSPFHVFKCLSMMHEERFIEPVPTRALMASGQECANEGRLQDAINLYEKAIAEEEGLPEVHTLAAEAYDAVGEYELSAYHSKCMAEIHAAQGNVREAIDLFHWVLESIPTDLAARQRVVELSVGHDDLATEDFNPLRVGKDLVDLYLEIGEIDRVRSILEDLLREHPQDLELKKSLINVHSKAGDVKRVVELYESIAADLARQGDPIQAVKYLQKILQIDRGRVDISERIKQLYRADERRRSRRRSLVGLGMVFMMLVLAGVGYFFYDQHARERYEAMDLKPLTDKRDYAGAIQALKRFQSAFPFTTAVKDAEAEIVDLKARRAAFDAEIDRQENAIKQKLDGRRREYKLAWKNHDRLFQEGRLAEALTVLDSVRRLLRETNEAQDIAWEQRNKVHKNYEHLKNYLGEAARLERKARQELDSGNWRGARAHLLNLVGKYGLSDQARIALVPVRIDSRPRGAQIYQDGRPVLVEQAGKRRPVTTPAVVFCKAADRLEFEIRRSGFRSRPLVVAPLKQESVGTLLTIVPETIEGLPAPAISSPGVGPAGGLAVGLRGGSLAVTSQLGARKPTVLALKGLNEVSGVPAVTAGGAIFATNEGEVVCHSLRDAQRLWGVKLRYPLERDPMVQNSRVFLADREGQLIVLSAGSGRELWRKRLAGTAGGRLTVLGRTLAVGTQQGEVLFLDAANGKQLGRISGLPGITTQVLLTKTRAVFGTEDGRLRCFNMATARPEWDHDLSRAARERELRFADDKSQSVYVIAADQTLKRLRMGDGKLLASRKMPYALRSDLQVGAAGVFVVLSEELPDADPKGLEQKFRRQDLLYCLDADDLSVKWEFRDSGDFRDRMVRGEDGSLLLTGTEGGVYRFQ